MKFISLIFFVAAMTGTWMASHAKRAVPESVHTGIQDDLKRIIGDLLQKNAPDAKNLVFERFYTQTNSPAKVTAYFSYAFDDKTEEGAPTRTQIAGSAILNKTGETPEESTWSLDELKLLDSAVDFNEPLQITATAQPTPAAAPTPPTHK
jgi:hypothetical protein